MRSIWREKASVGMTNPVRGQEEPDKPDQSLADFVQDGSMETEPRTPAHGRRSHSRRRRKHVYPRLTRREKQDRILRRMDRWSHFRTHL